MGGQRQKGGKDFMILAQPDKELKVRHNRNVSSSNCGALYDWVNRTQDGFTCGSEGRIGMVNRVGCAAVAGSVRGRDRGWVLEDLILEGTTLSGRKGRSTV